MNIINLYKELSEYINEHYCVLKYDLNYFLEMYQTDTRKDLIKTHHFDIFKVGTESNKISLKLIAPSENIAKDIELLASGIIKDKIGEIGDGVINSLKNSYVKRIGNSVNLYIYNSNITDYFNKNQFQQNALNSYQKEFKNLKQNTSNTITINLPNKSNQQFWDYVFDIIGTFVGCCRSQWIWKKQNNHDYFNPKLKFNKVRSEFSKHELFFHLNLDGQHNPEINKAIKLINKKYKVSIDFHGKNH